MSGSINVYVRVYRNFIIRQVAQASRQLGVYLQSSQVGARIPAWPRGGVRSLPSFTILIPTVTHPPHDFIVFSIVTIHHVSNASYNRIFKYLTFPSYLRSCPQVLPKADQEGPPHPSACPTVAGLRLNYRHNCHPPRSSPRIRQVSQWRREVDKVVGPNRERPQRVFCHHFRWSQSGASLLLTYCTLLIYILQVFSPASVIFTGVDVLLSVSILSIALGGSISDRRSYRRPRELRQPKTFSRNSLIE